MSLDFIYGEEPLSDMEKVILVDSEDNQIGEEEKLKAHRKGLLHRAFSVFVFNSKNEMMIQKRLISKYHSGGLWSNTCCGHPKVGEEIDKAATRRLREEMGFRSELREVFTFKYKVGFENGLFEHEIDHVFIGRYDGEAVCNPKEVENWKWIGLGEIKDEIEKHPEKYSFWLKSVCERVISLVEN